MHQRLKITPEAVRQAYIAKDVRPQTGRFHLTTNEEGKFCLRSGTETCCAMSVMLLGQDCPEVMRAQHPDGDPRLERIAESLLGIEDMWSFARGFDQAYHVPPDQRAPFGEEYVLGAACYDAVKDLIKP